MAARVPPDWGRLMRCIPLLLWSLAATQGAPQATISVNVELVVLQATVRDRSGALAEDLQRRNFTVFEDGARQSISVFRHEDFALTVGLVVDHSGSMRAKLPQVVAAARTFVRFSSSEDEMFVVNFNENVSLGLRPPGKFSNRQEELAEAILRTVPAGQTALYDAIAEGLRQLRRGSREKKVLIVFSDGADNTSKVKLDEVLRLAVESNAAIYTIGVFDEEDPDRNPGVLRRISRTTGGEMFIPSSALDLTAICERIATAIRRQYTIGYSSNRTGPPGVFRKVRVTAEAPTRGKLSVLTRSGYLAGGGK